MLYELLYSSIATATFDEGGVEELLVRARARNIQCNVTGVLFFNGRKFLQLLEGPKEHVDELFTIIKEDSRHSQVTVFHTGEIDERAFEGWAMAYETLGTETSIGSWQDQLTMTARKERGHLTNIGYRLLRLMRHEPFETAAG